MNADEARKLSLQTMEKEKEKGKQELLNESKIYANIHQAIEERAKQGLTNLTATIKDYSKEEVFFMMDALLGEGYGVKLTERRFGLGYIVEITW